MVHWRCKLVLGRSVCVSIRNSVSDGMLNVDDDIRRFQKCSLRLNLPAIPVSTEKRTRGNHISKHLLPDLDSFGSNSKYNLWGRASQWNRWRHLLPSSSARHKRQQSCTSVEKSSQEKKWLWNADTDDNHDYVYDIAINVIMVSSIIIILRLKTSEIKTCSSLFSTNIFINYLIGSIPVH